MATTALRCLRQFECPAVLFVPTDFIGQENIWDQGSEPRELLCGWKELRELERNGVSIQSHAASHRWLSKLDLQCQEQELTRSKAVLEDGLNKTVELLAYPFGAPVSDLALVGRAGYSAAFIYGGPGSLLSGPIGDRYRIARIAMGPDTNLASILSQP
jgi:peptidoglycan/xylan/chitin deacetylase (PgdA/CDA1 family)